MSEKTQAVGAPLERQVRPRFCRPMERNYITKAATNATQALCMAKEISAVCDVAHADWPPRQVPEGIQDLVQIINSTALLLIRRCHEVAHEIDGA